ncbi:hypothetical protein HD806DRAFT_532747 [Xylariaceae sp. AK1471]|nr:hypothetical protein HD806DRAFT_532747 [Xylariaceae sp. AK1471]
MSTSSQLPSKPPLPIEDRRLLDKIAEKYLDSDCLITTGLTQVCVDEKGQLIPIHPAHWSDMPEMQRITIHFKAPDNSKPGEEWDIFIDKIRQAHWAEEKEERLHVKRFMIEIYSYIDSYSDSGGESVKRRTNKWYAALVDLYIQGCEPGSQFWEVTCFPQSVLLSLQREVTRIIDSGGFGGVEYRALKDRMARIRDLRSGMEDKGCEYNDGFDPEPNHYEIGLIRRAHGSGTQLS